MGANHPKNLVSHWEPCYWDSHMIERWINAITADWHDDVGWYEFVSAERYLSAFSCRSQQEDVEDDRDRLEAMREEYNGLLNRALDADVEAAIEAEIYFVDFGEDAYDELQIRINALYIDWLINEKDQNPKYLAEIQRREDAAYWRWLR